MFSRFKSQKSWSNPLKPSCSHDFSIRCSSHFFGNCQDLPGEAPHRRGLARPHLRPDLERRRGRAQGPGPGPSGAAGRPGRRASDGRGVPGSTGGVPWRSLLWMVQGGAPQTL